jgi:hypothetical protein
MGSNIIFWSLQLLLIQNLLRLMISQYRLWTMINATMLLALSLPEALELSCPILLSTRELIVRLDLAMGHRPVWTLEFGTKWRALGDLPLRLLVQKILRSIRIFRCFKAVVIILPVSTGSTTFVGLKDQ